MVPRTRDTITIAADLAAIDSSINAWSGRAALPIDTRNGKTNVGIFDGVHRLLLYPPLNVFCRVFLSVFPDTVDH